LFLVIELIDDQLQKTKGKRPTFEGFPRISKDLSK
jgi:hypothetical protein